MSSSSRTAFLALAGAAALTLGACATDRAEEARPSARLATDQFPLRAEAHPDEIQLAARVQGLSVEQRSALAGLLGRWREKGGGELTVRSPVRGADPRAAYETSQRAREFLIAMGAPPERVVLAGYEPPAPQGGQAAVAPVLVGFSAYEPVIHRCGLGWENLSHTTKNRPTENFGCAVTANMATQIANPADIAAPRASDPADAGRRTTVLDKYRAGDPTSGAADKQASGAISKTASQGGGN